MLKSKTSTVVFILLLVVIPAQTKYYKDSQHLKYIYNFVKSVIEAVTNNYDSIAFNYLDYYPKMHILQGYWLTDVRLRGLNTAKVTVSAKSQTLTINGMALYLDAIINEKWTITVKISNPIALFSFNNPSQYFQLEYFGVFFDKPQLSVNHYLDFIVDKMIPQSWYERIFNRCEVEIETAIKTLLRDHKRKIEEIVQNIDSNSNAVQFVENILGRPHIVATEGQIRIDLQQIVQKNSHRRVVIRKEKEEIVEEND